MRTAREVIAEATWEYDECIGEVPVNWPEKWEDLPPGVEKLYGARADAALAALRAEGLVIVAAADLALASSSVRCDAALTADSAYASIRKDAPDLFALADRLDAALAAGGTDGH